MPVVWIVVIAIVVLIIMYIISTYNSLVHLRNNVAAQFANIDVCLKKRFDLIPNLVETIKGYAKHEKETFTAVVEARNKYQTANTPEEKMEADSELTKGLSKLFALAEAYPELKASENFMQLQGELDKVEEDIAIQRKAYNEAVRIYNGKVQYFPSNIVAKMFHFEVAKFFEAAAVERENVKVQF